MFLHIKPILKKKAQTKSTDQSCHCDQSDDTLTAKAKTLVREKKAISSVWYKPDIAGNIKRLFYVAAAQYRHFEKYRTYCKDYK